MTEKTSEPLPGDCLLSITQVMAKTSLSRSTIYRMVDADKFPKPVQVTDGRVAWWLSEVDDWTHARPRAKVTASAA